MDESNIYNIISKIIKHTIKLSLYTEILDVYECFLINMEKNIDIDTIINTKCSYTTGAIITLLNCQLNLIYSTPRQYNLDDVLIYKSETFIFDKNKLYTIELEGEIIKDGNVISAEPSHIFVLFNENDNWYMLDSYIEERELSYRIIDINILKTFISELLEKFSIEMWENLTHSTYRENIIPDKITMMIVEYDYDIYNIS